MNAKTVKKTKGRIEISEELCKGCGYCVEACPKSVIRIGKRFNRMGYFIAEVSKPEDCTGCTACAESCPDIAILVWREEGSPKNPKIFWGAHEE